MSLGHIGVTANIQDVDAENSLEAQVCRLYFDRAVGLLLEMQKWSFASEQELLALVTTDEHAEWNFQYKYPSDVARVNYILLPGMRNPPVDSKVPFRIVNNDVSDTGKLILTDQEGACIDFNKVITNTALFTETFIQALSYFLAGQIGRPLRIADTIIAQMAPLAQAFLDEATKQVFSEQQEDPEQPSEFQTVRN